MRLLIKRDPTLLVETKGKSELDSDVPIKLRKPYVVKSDLVGQVAEREGDDLLISESKDYQEIDNHLHLEQARLPAVWSGHRSVLVSNGNGGLYRIKGVSLNPKQPRVEDLSDTEFQVFGGQPRYSAEFEKDMSDRFNHVLRREGVNPVMVCKGYWHYPTKVYGYKYSASVIQVEGDTRLDEFMFLIEQFLYERTNGEASVSSDGEELYNNLKRLYHEIGFTVGRLKSLMDKNNQTWSCEDGRSNAHIGNVVLYNGTDKVRLGFVDFDASCDTDDFSVSQLRDLQEHELMTIKNSAMQGAISLRPIQARYLKNKKDLVLYKELREKFINGFETGYHSSTRQGYNNSIDLTKFLEVFKMLKSSVSLIPFRRGYGLLYDDYLIKRGYGLEKIIDDQGYEKTDYSSDSGIDNIIKNNHFYQSSINKP